MSRAKNEEVWRSDFQALMDGSATEIVQYWIGTDSPVMSLSAARLYAHYIFIRVFGILRERGTDE